MKKTQGGVSERRVLEYLGAEYHRGSGSVDFRKSDGHKGGVQIECKSTRHKSFALKYDVWRKIRQEALPLGRTPLLTVSFVDPRGVNRHGGDLAVISLEEYRGMLEFCEEHGYFLEES